MPAEAGEGDSVVGSEEEAAALAPVEVDLEEAVVVSVGVAALATADSALGPLVSQNLQMVQWNPEIFRHAVLAHRKALSFL
eukprot:m.401831 g.401831  ORF g.401831 m.401831 type:complete len:81 (+) comp16785_c1_seq62:844-1086(+)